MGGINWGSVPDYVVAAATIGALVAAALAARYTWRQLKIEQARDWERDVERRAEQASGVAAWEESRIVKGSLIPRPQNGVVVSNGSVLPVWGVSISWFLPSDSQRLLTALRRAAIAPGETFILPPLDLGELATQASDNVEPLNGYHVALHFRDAAGRWWRRDRLGRLHPSSEADSPAATTEPVAPRNVRWEITQGSSKNRFVMRNVGRDAAHNITARLDSGIAKNLPDGSTIVEPGASVDFVATSATGSRLANELRVTWDGQSEPVAVPMP